MKRLGAFVLGSCLLASCAHRPAPQPVKVSAQINEEAQLEVAQQQLSEERFAYALESFRKFQKTYPQSRYFMSSRLGEAQSLEGLQEWNEALSIYKTVYEANVNAQPRIAALAQYRLSFCYEALGDDVKAVAALLGSLKSGAHLSQEVALAEIPARLAMLYGKEQNFLQSAQYMEQAQRGMVQLRGRPDVSQEMLAKASYQMGSVSLNQVSVDNFLQAAAAQKTVQKYLFQAMVMHKEPWSAKSGDKLVENYRDLWNVLMSLPSQGEDAESVMRNNRRMKLSLGTVYLDLLEDAEMYQDADKKKMNASEKKVATYISEMKTRVQAVLYDTESVMGLTPESEKLNSLRRSGRIIEKEKSQPQNKLSEDPNL